MYIWTVLVQRGSLLQWPRENKGPIDRTTSPPKKKQNKKTIWQKLRKKEKIHKTKKIDQNWPRSPHLPKINPAYAPNLQYCYNNLHQSFLSLCQEYRSHHHFVQYLVPFRLPLSWTLGYPVRKKVWKRETKCRKPSNKFIVCCTSTG